MRTARTELLAPQRDFLSVIVAYVDEGSQIVAVGVTLQDPDQASHDLAHGGPRPIGVEHVGHHVAGRPAENNARGSVDSRANSRLALSLLGLAPHARPSDNCLATYVPAVIWR